MTQRDYIAIATIIADEVGHTNPTQALAASNIARSLAELFARDNPYFKRGWFFAASGLDENGRVVEAA